YIIGQSGSAQLTLMADQYSLWRTARAIATAVYLLTLEASYLLIFIFVLPIEGFSVPIAGSKVYFFALCLSRSRLSEQNLRVDKWSLCRV
ncbi:MAG TPA: hypothetical protein VGT81_20685, partial [Casimicrobiaceae bacterium]|nr:hypothetical protein [Casimicrobiaceae bacterium]